MTCEIDDYYITKDNDEFYTFNGVVLLVDGKLRKVKSVREYCDDDGIYKLLIEGDE